MQSPRQSEKSNDSATPSPMLPEPTQSLCPWPRKRKVGSRLSMCEFATSTRSSNEPFYLPPVLSFARDDHDPPAICIPIKPRPTEAQRKRETTAQALYQALSEEELARAEELNGRWRQLLKDLEVELRSFSIREAICKKPTVSMRKPLKSKLMTKRSLGF